MPATTTTRKVLAKAAPHSPSPISFLIATRLWDKLDHETRAAFCDGGEVIDTPAGRYLYNSISALIGLPPL